MFIIDMINERSTNEIALYFTVGEAKDMINKLSELLSEPNANEHCHVYDERQGANNISFSIITDEKLRNIDRYTELERKVFLENTSD